jgi:primary-amine oxidase
MAVRSEGMTDVLVYVDGDAKPPTRYAHVVLDLRASDQQTYRDILVGPLPVNNLTTTWQSLEYPYTRKTGEHIRNLDANIATIYEWLYSVSVTVSDITLDLWNGTAIGLKNDTLDIWGQVIPGSPETMEMEADSCLGIDPMWQYDGKITRWDMFWNYPTVRWTLNMEDSWSLE